MDKYTNQHIARERTIYILGQGWANLVPRDIENHFMRACRAGITEEVVAHLCEDQILQHSGSSHSVNTGLKEVWEFHKPDDLEKDKGLMAAIHHNKTDVVKLLLKSYEKGKFLEDVLSPDTRNALLLFAQKRSKDTELKSIILEKSRTRDLTPNVEHTLELGDKNRRPSHRSKLRSLLTHGNC